MRYDVKIEMTLIHVQAIEAGSPVEAQQKALGNIGSRDAEEVHMVVMVERSAFDRVK